MRLPSVTIVTPTLNSERTIRQYLEGIGQQDYPRESLEVIIADGGSTDETLRIIDSVKTAKALNVKVVPNKLKTGEAGKAVGAKLAQGEVVAFIDSDNILPSRDWLKRMVEPSDDKEIAAFEPLEYTYRKGDGYITRYSALIGMNDPVCLFLGNYDRLSTLTGKWTRMPYKQEDRGRYLKLELDKNQLPTIGANGFLIRKHILDKYEIGDYLFDIDVVYDLLNRSHSFRVAKVKIGIIHIFCGGLKDFVRKQQRRIKDYAYYKKQGLRKYQWSKVRMLGLIKFGIYNILIFPLFIQALRGFAKKRDSAWFFHIPACMLTFFVYAFSSVQNFFISKPLNRDKWQFSKRVE